MNKYWRESLYYFCLGLVFAFLIGTALKRVQYNRGPASMSIEDENEIDKTFNEILDDLGENFEMSKQPSNAEVERFNKAVRLKVELDNRTIERDFNNLKIMPKDLNWATDLKIEDETELEHIEVEYESN